MSVVRQSKFRHIFGNPYKGELCFSGLKTEGSGDTNCSVSCKYLAVVKQSKIYVVGLDDVGRHEENSTPYIDCKSKVMDVAWSPFNDSILASGEESGTINVWIVPEEGMPEVLNEPFWQLAGVHTRKITSVLWHPTADFILAATGHDQFVSIWDCQNQTEAVEIPVGEMPTNIAFNMDGSCLAITTKENRVMSLSVVDARTGGVIVKNDEVHQGGKPTKCVFLKNGNIITIGADKQANRSICMWDGTDLSEKTSIDLGNSSGVQNVYYDYDLQVMYTHGKGECVVRFYEIDEEEGEIHYLNAYSSKESQKGGNFMPKRGVNTSSTEIARYYKLHANKCEPIPFIVPRKSEHFQSDLYPPCPSDEPALSAEEWLGGKNATPCKKEFAPTGAASTKREPKKISKPMTKKAPPPSSRGECKSTAAAAPAATNGVPEGIDFAELLEDMKKVKATVRKLNKRVAKLEEMLEQQQGAEEEEE